jgi:secretion/DNA translocation related TadE-like protein
MTRPQAPPPGPAHPDRGSASLLVLVHLGVLLLLACALATVSALVVAHRQAQAAADLAALAGARAIVGGDAGCRAAAMIARSNDGTLRGCRSDGVEVVVHVSVPAPRWAVVLPDPVGHARAGPS